jgi:hypothetical protein
LEEYVKDPSSHWNCIPMNWKALGLVLVCVGGCILASFAIMEVLMIVAYLGLLVVFGATLYFIYTIGCDLFPTKKQKEEAAARKKIRDEFGGDGVSH